MVLCVVVIDLIPSGYKFSSDIKVQLMILRRISISDFLLNHKNKCCKCGEIWFIWSWLKSCVLLKIIFEQSQFCIVSCCNLKYIYEISRYRNGTRITNAKSDKETKKATIRLLRFGLFSVVVNLMSFLRES